MSYRGVFNSLFYFKQTKMLNSTKIRGKKSMYKVLKRPVIFGLVVIFIVTLLMFSVSAFMRSDQFGKLNLEHHNHLTGSTVIFAANWYNENPFSLGFKMYYLGKSIDAQTPEKRFVYDTYPPGAIIPIYLISVISRTPPNPAMVMGYNLFGHFWTAFLLAAALFLTLRRIRFNYICSILLSFVTAAIVLFMPQTMYYLQTVFFSDQAVILPFAALIFLEVARDLAYNSKHKRILDILEWIVIFYGVFTDWLFVFVCVVLFVKRLINGQLGKKFKDIVFNTSRLAAPAFLAVFIYVLQLLTNKSSRFLGVFLQRTGIKDEQGWVNWFDAMVWGKYLQAGYGPWANLIIWTSFFAAVGLVLYALFALFMRTRFAAAKEDKKKYINENLICILNFLMLIVFPCFIQLYTFKNHSAIHDFSVVKLSFILSTCWVMLPVTLYIVIRDIARLSRKAVLNTFVACLVTAVVLVSAGGYMYFVTPTYRDMYPPSTPELEKYGTFVRDNTDYYDVVFSADYSITPYHHQKLCWSLKQIRQIKSISDIESVISSLPSEARAAVFITDKNRVPNWLKPFIDNAVLYKEQDGMCIYKMTKQEFVQKNMR